MKHCDDLTCSLCYNADGLSLSDGGHVPLPESESDESDSVDDSPLDDDTQ